VGRRREGALRALGIDKPIVYGASFGGFVAQSYATRHPDHPCQARAGEHGRPGGVRDRLEAFDRIGGPGARQVAEAYWLNPTVESRARYFEVCLPLYRPRPPENDHVRRRGIIKNDVALHFNGPGNEHGRMDFRAALRDVRCPVLVLAGELDPVTPVPFSETIAACLPPHLVRFERFAGCGHGVVPDDPERVFAVLRAFIENGA
jgi:proline iminopeptidase